MAPEDNLPAGQREAQIEQVSRDIGSELLPWNRIEKRFDGFKKQLRIGLDRTDPTAFPGDGGMLATRTPIPDIKSAWPLVPEGKESVTYIGNFGGTNWRSMRAEKQVGPDGMPVIVKEEGNITEYHENQSKEYTWDEFIGQMAYSIAGQYLDRAISGNPDDRIDVGVSFGFPHRNEIHEHGIDSILEPLQDDGTLPKGWKITDWPDLDPQTRGNVSASLREKLVHLGVNVGNIGPIELRPGEVAIPDSHIGTIVSINDTNATRHDMEAERKAAEKRWIVLDASIVGGTGTNSSVDGVNLESGRLRNYAPNETIPEIEQIEDKIHERMVRNKWVKGEDEIEHQTGAAVTYRIAAAYQLLEESGLFDEGQELAAELIRESENNQGIVDQIAQGYIHNKGERRKAVPKIAKDTAERELIRAGQNYGMLIAATADEAFRLQGITPEPEATYALLAEGGVLLKGLNVLKTAELTASKLLNFNIKIEPADSEKGVAAQAMSFRHLQAA